MPEHEQKYAGICVFIFLIVDKGGIVRTPFLGGYVDINITLWLTMASSHLRYKHPNLWSYLFSFV